MAKLNIPLPSKGLVVDRPAEYVDSRSMASQNMEFNRGIIRKRIGTSAVGSALGERVQRIFELQVGNSTRLVRVGPTKIEALNKSTGVWSSIAHSALTATEVDMVDYAYPTLSGVKIAAYTNGIDPIRKFATSSNDADLGGSPPVCKFMQAFGPYLVLANITDSGDFPSRVQWCDTGDPETWSPASDNNAGSEELLTDPGDITGLGQFGNFLTVHKPNAIYLGQLVTTADVIRFDRKATGVGTCAAASIQNLPSGEQIFLAADGIHLFNGITAPLIESPIQDELREELNPQFLYKAQSIFVQELDEYWVCVCTGSDEDPQTVYKYNWRTQQIYKDARADMTALGVFLNTVQDAWDDDTATWDSDTTRWNSSINLSLNPLVMFGDSAGVTTKRTSNSADDAGVAVNAYADTKDFTSTDFGIPDIDRIMRWKGLQVWAKGSGVSIYYSLDGGVSWTLAKASTLTSDYPDDDAPIMVYFDKVKSRIRLRFKNAVLGGSFTLKKYILEASQREVRK